MQGASQEIPSREKNVQPLRGSERIRQAPDRIDL